MTAKSSSLFLILSQVYPPDPASVGQHIHDAAAEMARRGHDVRVLTSGRGYDDPTIKYPPREVRNGVDVRRLPLSSFGKKSIPIRLAAQGLFLAQAIIRALFMPRLAAIMVSTSPPMCSVAALIIAFFRRVPIKYWVMDLNPDQMIAMNKISAGSLSARVFNAFNRSILKRASDVVVMDRFMAQRVNAKRDVSAKMSVMPPWPHEDDLEPIPHDSNPFRKAHGLDGRFVVMYSGNHSPANPIKTVLDAAERLQDDSRLVFMFIGGMGFILLFQVARGKFSALLLDTQLRWYAIYIGAFILAMTMWQVVGNERDFWSALTASAFNVVSIATTTGFASEDFLLWGSLPVAGFMVLMFIGGCTGSTAGGIKVFRYCILGGVAHGLLHNLMHPHRVQQTTYNGRPVGDDVIRSVLGFFFFYMAAFAILTLVFSLFVGDLTLGLSAVGQALGNVGPGLVPSIGPVGHFGGLPDGAKWVLSLAMLLGRLELLTILVLFLPTFWRG